MKNNRVLETGSERVTSSTKVSPLQPGVLSPELSGFHVRKGAIIVLPGFLSPFSCQVQLIHRSVHRFESL